MVIIVFPALGWAAVDRAHGGTTLGDGNRTIEDLLKEVMRPMVKEWLDANLPTMTQLARPGGRLWRRPAFTG